MYALPLELLDVILQKAVLVAMLHRSGGNNHPRDSVILMALMSVDFCWFQRIRRRRFKGAIRRYLTVHYRREASGAVVLRNNRKYLSANLDAIQLLAFLLSTDWLSDDQSSSISSRQLLNRDSNEECLLSLSSLNASGHNALLHFLHKTQQHNAAAVTERGGIVIKARVQNERTANLKLEEQKLTETFRALKDKRLPVTVDVQRVLGQLQNNDIRVLSLSQRSGVEVWMWCQTVEAVQRFQHMKDSGNILTMLKHLFRLLSSGALSPRVVNIDAVQFTRDVVNFPVDVNLIAEMDVGAEYVYGVCKLHGSIYVLTHKPNSVLVYSDENHTVLQREIKLGEEIKWPLDMAACRMSSCLYIVDRDNTCVWKVGNAGSNTAVRWLAGIDWPFTMSVSETGNIVMMRWGQPSVLELYRSDASLILSVPFPANIEYPWHAVETSKGNFVISHWKRDSNFWSVVELSRDGVILCRFLPIDDANHLNYPYHLTIGLFDEVLVADQYNRRVILLDSELNWNRVLLHRIEILPPKRLYFDKEQRQLLVAHGRKASLYILKSKLITYL